MKKNSVMAMIFAALFVFTVGAGICPAQPGRMVGGYRDVSKTDEMVVGAAVFAVKTRAQTDETLELTTIERAERQIVAGSNFRMCLSVTSKGKAEQATATVYLNLQNEFALSEWKAGKCSDNGSNETTETADENDSVAYEGKLEVGKTTSTILYVGEETGDYAAFCFPNNSAVGRAVLKVCKNGGQCEFTGKVDFETACTVKNLEANLSASGKITSVETVKAIGKAASMVKTAVVSKALAPEVIVKNLYAAQKTDKDAPFFQIKNRAAVDKYFEEDFADLIWNDATSANGEAGTINFDPLFNSQDQEITLFKIGKSEYFDDIATVSVSFKNFGKAETIKFFLEKQADKSWKIKDIGYADGTTLVSMLFDAKLRDETNQ